MILASRTSKEYKMNFCEPADGLPALLVEAEERVTGDSDDRRLELSDQRSELVLG